MTLEEKIRKIEEIKNDITKNYVKLDELKKEVIKEMLEIEVKDFKLDDQLRATIVWIVNKSIDYNKLMEKYPDIYELGLKTTFSATQALNSVSLQLLNKVLKDCTVNDMGYDIKLQKGK